MNFLLKLTLWNLLSQNLTGLINKTRILETSRRRIRIQNNLVFKARKVETSRKMGSQRKDLVVVMFVVSQAIRLGNATTVRMLQTMARNRIKPRIKLMLQKILMKLLLL